MTYNERTRLRMRLWSIHWELLRLLGQCDHLLDRLAEGWQDENRTYTPAERQLDVRLDRSIVLA